MNAPFNPSRVAAREPFAAFVCDEPAAELMRPIAAELGWTPDKVSKGGLRDAIHALSVSSSPQILFVDLSDAADPLNDINGLAEVCEPGTIVIAAGQVNDVRLYRDLIASGIHDYLLKPLNPDALREAFLSAQSLLNAPRASEGVTDLPHCAAAIIGARGGVGATSVAASLAWLLSAKMGRTTALLDLDVHFGTGALSLDLEPGRGLTDAIENPSRIDGLFIERAMVKASDRLSVLSAEAPIHTPILTDGSAFLQLQEEIRHAFEATIIDMPRAMLVNHPHLIADIRVAVIVTELTLAAARDTIRLLSWFRSNAPHTEIIILGNRMHPAAILEISRKDFEGSIERKIDFTLPFDAKTASNAAKLGQPIAEVAKAQKPFAPLSLLAAQIAALAEAGSSVNEKSGGAAKRTSIIAKLKGKLARPKSKQRAA